MSAMQGDRLISQTRYKPTWEVKGIDKQADQLHDEYMDKARRGDRLYCETQPGQVGPIKRKLLSFEQVRGLVFWAFGWPVSQSTRLWTPWPHPTLQWQCHKGGGSFLLHDYENTDFSGK